ncbi:uncharacterized protein [Panulirus ornatus]|uniref:uncharacterized protein n=1 Tax=Panulirus ornatus TaxID=150431 RepID=UPI003A8787CD
MGKEFGKAFRAGVLVTMVACLLLYSWRRLILRWTPDEDVSVGGVEEELLQLPTCPVQESCPAGVSHLAVSHRRRLAFTLAHVQRQISRLAGTRAVVDVKWAVVLGALVAELAPPGYTSNLLYSDRLEDMGPAPSVPTRTRHVCPEAYFGNMYDRAFGQHGMETERCTYVPAFSSVLTVILPAQSWPPETINFVVTQMREIYDIPIIVILPKTVTIDDRHKNVKIVRKAEETLTDAQCLNEAIEAVETPYVFIGWSLAHFSNQSSLERLVRVMDEVPYVEVVGGAARDLQGHWTHGCLQQRMADYQATYTMGYYHSKYECMYCDDLLTPFAATAKMLIKIPFTASLSGPAVYRDWFAKLRRAGQLAMVCPDVMFFVGNHVQMTRDQWKLVASHWSLEIIHSYSGESYNFSCESVGISCKNPLKIIGYFLLPPCCRAIMEKELQYLMDYGEQHKIEYELQSGSALSAVKMGRYAPWDFDHDMQFPRHEYKAWLSMRKPYLKSKKCTLSISKKGIYFTAHCPYFFLEFYSHANFTSRQFLPAEYREIPTSIMYAGRWTVVMSNPGLFTRNKLGIDDLKHAAHWRTLNVTKVGKKKGGYESPGKWTPCITPEHHSCQDRYPGDGNLPFIRPFLHP